MNITKQRILEIIKEEVEAAKQDDSNTKQKLRQDFLTVAKEFIPDADMVSAEVELTSALMTKILKKAGESGTSATQLKKLNDIAGKLLSEAKKEIVDQVNAYFSSLQTSGKEIYELVNFPNTKPENWRKVSQLRFSPRTTDDYNVMNALLEVVPEQGDKSQMNFTTDTEVKNLMNLFKTKEEVEKLTAAPEPEQQSEPEAPTAPEKPAKEGETEVEVGGREYTYTNENIQELKTAYEAFEKGFMSVKTLRDQEELWIGLRNALNNIGKFRTIGNQETALATESINIHEQENTQKAKILIRDLERLRKDFNDTDEVLEKYIEEAEKGNYQAKAYLARFLAEIKDVQNSIARTVDDTKKLTGIEPMEEQLTGVEEEETIDQKIQNVRNVYENIKYLLGGALPEIGKTVEGDFKEVSGNVKESYEELMKIRKYFRNVGAFAKTSDKDVGELKQDYLITKKGVSKSMSRFIDDLRRGTIDNKNVSIFLRNMVDIGEFITEKFGVGPDKGYGFKTIEVESDDVTKDEIESITDEKGKPSLIDKATDAVLGFVGDRLKSRAGAEDGEEPDEAAPEPEEVEKAKVDVVKFLSDSNKFIKNFTTPLFKILNNQESSDEDKVREINKLKTEMTKKRMLQEEAEDIGSIVQKAYNAEATIKDVFRNATTTKFVEERIPVLKAIKVYYQYRKKFDELQKTKPDELDEWNQEIDGLTAKLADIAGKVVNKTVEEPEIKSALFDDIENLGDGTTSEIILQQRKKARAKDAERSRQRKITTIMQRDSDPKVYGTDPTRVYQESKNLLERLIKEELKVLNGKKMVRN